MKVSVIIPAYQAAGYLETCLLPLVENPPELDYEILVVDDGSKDETFEVASRLARRFPVIRPLRQENGGPASARNFGIRHACGKYLVFCDSDDRMSAREIGQAVAAAEERECDLLIFGYRILRDEQSFDYCYPNTEIFSSEALKEHLIPLYRANMINQVWGKVFRADFIREEAICFPDEMWGEDRLFLFSVLQKAKRVRVISDCLYGYVQQKNSLISRFLPGKALACQKIHREIFSLCRSLGDVSPQEEDFLSYMYVKSLLSVFATLFAPGCPLSHREKRLFVKEVLAQEDLNEVKGFPPSCGKSFSILARIVLSRSVSANLLAAWGMKTVSRVLPGLFRRAKHAYNK